MKDGFLADPGIAYRTNAFIEGRKTLVFIHGLSGSSSAWKSFEDALSDSYNIVTYDLRGHALSKRYVEYSEYELQTFGDDLYALLTHLEVTQCILISHSLGTLIAVSFLHKYQHIAKSVVFLAPTYKQYTTTTVHATQPFLKTAVRFFSLLPFSPKTGHRIDYSKLTHSPDISLKRIVPEISDMTLRLYLYCLEHLYAFKNDRWWSEITIPVTILHGTKDTFAPYKNSQALTKAIPNAKFITLPKANHMLVINNKKEIIEIIRGL